jgi:branched-subunit amino acid aminotransferase/4-amino-4-deoxychorismate lyase
VKTRLINFNGNVCAEDELVFPVTERILRYGDGLFESMRACNGKIMWIAEHYNRLYSGARLLRLPLEDVLPFERFSEQAHYLLASNAFKNARLRFCVYRKGDGFYTPEKNTTGYFIEVTESPEPHYSFNESGLKLGIYTGQFKSCTSLSNYKTNNALLYVLAGLYKNEQQLDECLILNQKGCIAEAISANVFVVKKGKMFTPAANQGCIMGIMRKKIIELAHQQSIEVNEGVLTFDDLLDADEIFLTNASRGIQWVDNLLDKHYEQSLSRNLLSALNSAIV